MLPNYEHNVHSTFKASRKKCWNYHTRHQTTISTDKI